MKGKIDKDGCLLIERAGVMKPQHCPLTDDPSSNCGDWCPLFGEPENSNTIPENWTLELNCGAHKTFYFTGFTDERKEAKKDG